MTNPEQNESLRDVAKGIEHNARNIGYLEAVHDVYEWVQVTDIPSEIKVLLLEKLEKLLSARRKSDDIVKDGGEYGT